MNKLTKLFISTTVLSVMNLNAGLLSNLISVKDFVPTSNSDKEVVFKNEKVNINSLMVKKYINDKNCNKILSNGGFFTTCYDNKLKSAISGYSKINGKLVNEGNLKEREDFFTDLNLDEDSRTTYNDYIKSGFDRGHTIVNDASFDYSQRSVLSTYSMSNITPQYPNTNRKSYLAVEKYERLVASKLGEVETLTLINFDNKKIRIGRSQLSVPSSYDKVFWNESKEFQKCFHIENDDVIYSLKEMEIDCKKVLR